MEFIVEPKTILNAIFFKGGSIYKLSEKVEFKLGALAIFVSAFLLAIPTDLETFSLFSWGQNFITVYVGLFITLSLIFGFAKLLRADVDYETFLAVTSFVLAASLVVVSVPILIIFEFVLGIKALSAVLFSLVPFYNFVIFGYACEVIAYSERSIDFRRVLIALFAMTIIFLFYFLLTFITV